MCAGYCGMYLGMWANVKATPNMRKFRDASSPVNMCPAKFVPQHFLGIYLANFGYCCPNFRAKGFVLNAS